MSTGIFHTPHERGILFRQRQRIERRNIAPKPAPTPSAPKALRPKPVKAKEPGKTVAQMGQLADMMADGCPSIHEAARRMELSQSRVDRLWQRIRRELGEQAR